MRKLLCWIGYHRWVLTLKDYIDNNHEVYMPDGTVHPKAICTYCRERGTTNES